MGCWSNYDKRADKKKKIQEENKRSITVGYNEIQEVPHEWAVSTHGAFGVAFSKNLVCSVNCSSMFGVRVVNILEELIAFQGYMSNSLVLSKTEIESKR